MKKLSAMLVLAGIGFVPAMALADTIPAPAEPAAAPAPDPSAITVTGYVDAGYTSMNTTGFFGDGVTPARVFDTPHPDTGKKFSSVNLNQAAVTVSRAPKEGWGGVVNLTAGRDANIFSSYGAGNNGLFYNNGHNFDLTQAYGSYTAGQLTVIAGKFVTLAGVEYIASTSDTNYSRSLLFGYAIPFTHTGLRATYAVNDMVSIIVGVNRGWDQVSDMNSDKTIELGFTATPNKTFSLAGVYYGGKELANPGSPVSLTPAHLATNGNRQLFDLVMTLNATDQLTFIFNYDNGSQDNASASDASGASTARWDGMAAYANYQVNEKWRVSLRGEYLNDRDGYRLYTPTSIGQRESEATLTLAYMPAASFELRGEVRGDKSNQNVFLGSDGTPRSRQTSFGLEALYKF